MGYKKGMRVPGRVYAGEEMLEAILGDNCLEQLANVACLPGIQNYSLAMPDIHWGYGFPIGGVAATAVQEGGVISPGGVGYDICCGVRLLRTSLKEKDLKPKMQALIAQLFRDVPCGLGGGGEELTGLEMKKMLQEGARWAVDRGFGEARDLEFIEEGGVFTDVDPSWASRRAMERGANQLGSLGSGNHFLEVQVADEIFDEAAARVMGLEKGTVTVMIHCGSRGFGYQVCDDHLREMKRSPEKYDFSIPDRQLASAPIQSAEGRRYLNNMRLAANYAFANRQVLRGRVEQTFVKALGISPKSLGMELVYDLPHNIAKFEEHDCGGAQKKLCVHRKGATRAFGPGDPRIPEKYRPIGQPVLVPGDMARYSFVLLGTEGAMEQTFGTVCHGAGRRMSRSRIKRELRFQELKNLMDQRGVVMRARGRDTAVEEAPQAYKDVANVVEVCHGAGIARKAVRLRPLGVVKG